MLFFYPDFALDDRITDVVAESAELRAAAVEAARMSFHSRVSSPCNISSFS